MCPLTKLAEDQRVLQPQYSALLSPGTRSCVFRASCGEGRGCELGHLALTPARPVAPPVPLHWHLRGSPLGSCVKSLRRRLGGSDWVWRGRREPRGGRCPEPPAQEHCLSGLLPSVPPLLGTGLARRHARQAAQEPRLSRAPRATAAPTATPRRGSSTRVSSRPVRATCLPQHPVQGNVPHPAPPAPTWGQEGGCGNAHAVGSTDREVASCAAQVDEKRVVGQPWVVCGAQEEEFGGVGHDVPILVHPNDAGRGVGLHQHEEH